MDIGQALSFIFDDEQWVGKLLIGALISLIPIFGGFAVMGYAVAVLRNVEENRARPLPKWDRLGDYFVDGLLVWAATFVYSIPLLVLMCPLLFVWVLPALAGESEDLMAVLGGIAGIISLGVGCLALLYGLLLWLLSPVIQIRFAETGKLGSCLRFGEVFRFLFANIGPIIIAQLLVAAAGVVVSTVLGGVISVLSLIPICGWIVGAVLGLAMIPVGVWVLVFGAHLYAQIAQQSRSTAAYV
jgi:hypothetical protein